jgi:hypothetical protein
VLCNELLFSVDGGPNNPQQFKRYQPDTRVDFEMIEQIYGEAVPLTVLPQTVAMQLRNGLGLTPVSFYAFLFQFAADSNPRRKTPKFRSIFRKIEANFSAKQFPDLNSAIPN